MSLQPQQQARGRGSYPSPGFPGEARASLSCEMFLPVGLDGGPDSTPRRTYKSVDAQFGVEAWSHWTHPIRSGSGAAVRREEERRCEDAMGGGAVVLP